jgi:Eukaryotic membrane protein family
MCPSNTFIANNGDVYEIEPFMLPPPTEIAALFNELKDRRDRSDSNCIDSDARTLKYRAQRALEKEESNSNLNTPQKKHSRDGYNKHSHRPRISSFDSVTTDSSSRAEKSDPITPLRGKQAEQNAVSKKRVTIVPDDNISEKGSESDNASTRSRSDSISIPHQLVSRYQNNAVIEQPKKPESSIGAYPSFLHTDQPGQKNRDDEKFEWENFSIQKYLLTEMLGIGETGHLQPAAVGHMQNFLTVPSKVEAFIGFGFFICLDAFLNVITFLPLRVAYSLSLLLCESIGYLLKIALGITTLGIVGGKKKNRLRLRGYFQMCHLYDLMRGVFMLLSCYVLLRLNMSRVYHYIRGQTLIKLYVLTAMLEIFDKLLCSFGQDAFDSLYCITRMRPDPRSILFAFLVTAIYTTVHSGLYFMSIATLTVAINSADQALVTVLVLNNFGEIKSFVFKKFDNQNLFQLSCSDVTERFQLVRNSYFSFLIAELCSPKQHV